MEKAPQFTLESANGEQVSLPEKGKIVLYFYPKANTPGCTKEAQEFKQLYSEFIKADTIIMGISPDEVKDVKKFKDKYDFPFTLLADPEHNVCNDYGVWGTKKMYGKEYEGVTRTTFLIKDLKVLEKWKHRPEKTEEIILEAAKNL